jgi:hypothetical protein
MTAELLRLLERRTVAMLTLIYFPCCIKGPLGMGCLMVFGGLKVRLAFNRNFVQLDFFIVIIRPVLIIVI